MSSQTGALSSASGSALSTKSFDSFGVSFGERGSRTNQSLDIIRRLLSGETVTYKSDFFNFKNIKVTPEPIQKPHPPIWLGGFTSAALRRAARYGDGFTVPGATRDVYDNYLAELKKQNRPTENIRFASAVWCLIVSKDPEKTFAEAADHIIYQANDYSAWLSAAGLSPLSEHLRDSRLGQVEEHEFAVSQFVNWNGYDDAFGGYCENTFAGFREVA